MIRDINGVPIKDVYDRLRKGKEFFEAKLNHDALSIVPNITDSPVEPYVCNCVLQTEEEIISIIHCLRPKFLKKIAFGPNVVHYRS
ncbi:unnamed protein product [Dracunculus medinensis]|uniref:PDZ_3 domain-containing protein n=1 Tax=Dracunculus medinensis TaxID=318479 RepID=A0A0N4UI28_DRAME|nr:unnamed protein product [Dracunculus medinensis]